MTTARKSRTYCISLDDDPMIFKIIQEITKLPTLPFVSGEKLLERAASFHPVVAFIDIHLGTNELGLTVLPQLRAIWSHTPILVMTSDDAVHLIGQSLSLGANDFVKKPLRPDEVRARVQARIFEMNQREEAACFQIANIRCDRVHRLVEGPSGKRFLSESEWQLLACLAQAQGMFITKQDLKAKIWGDVAVSDNAVDRKLSTVRQALKDVSNQVQISAKYGQGVRLDVLTKDLNLSLDQTDEVSA